MLYIIGDTETAGLGEEKRLVEVALRLIDENMNTLTEWQSLVDPEIPINPDAQAIHGISDKDVQFAPTTSEFVGHVLGKKFDEDICLIAHNVAFDRPLLEIIGNITNTICTLDMARTYVKGPENYKLQTLREFFHIPEDIAHRAMGDVNVVHQLLRILVDISGRPLVQHAMVDDRVIHTMPFGKHAGKALFSLPYTYVSWLLSLPDLDKNLKNSLLAVKELKSDR